MNNILNFPKNFSPNNDDLKLKRIKKQQREEVEGIVCIATQCYRNNGEGCCMTNDYALVQIIPNGYGGASCSDYREKDE